jgi:hypothetical protein
MSHAVSVTRLIHHMTVATQSLHEIATSTLFGVFALHDV